MRMKMMNNLLVESELIYALQKEIRHRYPGCSNCMRDHMINGALTRMEYEAGYYERQVLNNAYQLSIVDTPSDVFAVMFHAGNGDTAKYLFFQNNAEARWVG